MTTKILIVNYGPDAIKVSTMPKDNDPDGIFTNMIPSQIDTVYPHSSQEFYVHYFQALRIDEVKPEQPIKSEQPEVKVEE